jgi:PAS domain S-box-containing protein
MTNEENTAQKISRILKVTPDIGTVIKKIREIHVVIDSDEPLDKKLRCILVGLPHVFRFPENLRISVQMDDFKLSSKDFKEEKCKLSLPILVHGKPRGQLTLCYSEMTVHSEEMPFNEFERMISNTFIEALGLATERKEDEEALMDSEELYHLLFNASRDAILMLAFDSTPKPVSIVEANDRALEILGYSKEELKTLTLTDLSNKASLDSSRDMMKKTLSDREGKFETALIRKGGKEVPLEINAHIFEYKGRPVTLCVLRDLSEKRHTEAVLHESEAKLKTLCDNMIDLISEVDMNGIFSFVSPSHEIVLGYSPDDLTGKCLFDFLHPVDADRMKAIVMGSIGKPGFGKLEIRFKHAHGYHIWLESIGKIRLNSSGYPVGVVITSRDITERKKIETKLKAEMDFSSAIIDVAQAMVIVFDAKGTILKFNRASENVTGFSAEEAIGKNLFDLFLRSLGEESILRGKKIFSEMLAGSHIIHYESQWLKKDGSPLIITWSATTLLDDHQRIEYIITTGIDVTGQRGAEATLLERLKLGELLNRISASAVRIDDLSEFLDRLLKDMGETIGTSRAFIFEFNVPKKTISQTYEWLAPGIPSDSQIWQDTPVASMPADYDAMMRQEVAVFGNVEQDHYDPRLREMLLREDIRALLSIPITLGDEPYGLIGLDIVGKTREWRKDEVDIVIAIARIIGHVIEREKKEKMLKIKDAAIEMSINSIIFADPDYKIIYVNKALLIDTGYKSKEEIIGKKIMELFPNSADEDRITKTLRKEGSIVTRTSMKKADGSSVEVEVVITAVTDSKGNLQMFMGSAINVPTLQGYLRKR